MSEHRVSRVAETAPPARSAQDTADQREERGEEQGSASVRWLQAMAMAGVASASRQWAQLAAWRRTREGKRFCALLAAATILRLALAPFMAFSSDLSTYFYWGTLARTHFLDAYSASTSASNPNYWLNYPPLALYLYGALEWVYTGAGHLLGLSLTQEIGGSHALKFLFKVPLIIADVALISLMYALIRARLSARWAWLAPATYAFSPAALIVALMWGQTDGIVLLLVALALLLCLRHEALWGGIVFGLAISFKLQPIIFVPLGLVYLYRWGGWRDALKAAAALTATCVVIWLPYLIPPRFEILVFVQTLLRWTRAVAPSASRGGFNVWYVLGRPSEDIAAPLLGPLSVQTVSTAAIGIVLALLVIGIWRDGSARTLWAAAATLALASFELQTLQYERYLFPAIALFALAAMYDRRYWICYVGVSVTLYINFASTVSGCNCFPHANLLAPGVLRLLLQHPELVAFANTALTMIALALFIDRAPLAKLAGLAAGSQYASHLRRGRDTMLALPSVKVALARGADTLQVSLVAAARATPPLIASVSLAAEGMARHTWARRLREKASQARFVVWLVPAVQVGVIAWVILTHTPSVPYWDEWANIHLVEHANAGTLTWNDFWTLHWYTHRIVLPRLLLLALVQLTHWNVRVEMLFNLGLAVVSAALVYACVRRTLRADQGALALVAPLSLLLFSLSFYGDWFAPFQIQFFLAVLGVVLALYGAQRYPRDTRGFLIALVGAFIATLSSFNGLAAWIVLLPSIIQMGRRRLAIWIGCGLGIGIYYMVGFPSPSASGGTAASPGQLAHLVGVAPTFMLAYLGAPLGYPSYKRSLFFGLAGFGAFCGALYLHWRSHRSLSDVLIWIELALYALATDAMTVIGRAGTGPDAAILSRYQIFPVLFWVATFVVVAVVVRDAATRLAHTFRARPFAVSSAVAGGLIASAVVLVALLHANMVGLREGIAWQDDLRANQWCILNYEKATDACLGAWWPITDKATNLAYAAYLRDHHYAIFFYGPA